MDVTRKFFEYTLQKSLPVRTVKASSLVDVRNSRIEPDYLIGHDGSALGKIVAFGNAMFLRRIKTAKDAGLLQVFRRRRPF